MDENKLRFGVGVLVISAIGIGIILVFLFGAFPSVLERDYSLLVKFPSAEGIGLNSPVMRDGVRVGRVSAIRLQEEGGVLVTLSMDADMPLPRTYIPQIGSGNLVTGDAKLEFVRADPNRLASIYEDDEETIANPYSDGEYFAYGRKAESLTDIQDELQETLRSIRVAGESIAAAGESVNSLSSQLRDTMGGTDQQVDRVAQEAIQAFNEFENAMGEVRSLVGD